MAGDIERIELLCPPGMTAGDQTSFDAPREFPVSLTYYKDTKDYSLQYNGARMSSSEMHALVNFIQVFLAEYTTEEIRDCAGCMWTHNRDVRGLPIQVKIRKF